MEVYSWLRRSVSSRPKAQNDDVLESFGITEKLIEFIKSFSIDTFKNFPLLPEDEEAAIGEISGNVREDLSEWQEQHATLVLSRVKELSHLRFRLCPGRLKEREFWRIYFTLVKGYISEYQLRAIQLARLRQMTIENDAVQSKSSCEVEMSETKQVRVQSPSTFPEHYLDSMRYDPEMGKE